MWGLIIIILKFSCNMQKTCVMARKSSARVLVRDSTLDAVRLS